MTDVFASLPPKPVPAHAPAHDMRSEWDDYTSPGEGGQFWSSEEGPTFAEFLDIINPLHHLPVVSTIYRAITGDQISTGSRFFGGILFGGLGGAISAGVAALFEEASGGDLGQHLAELVDDITGGGTDRDGAPNVAAATANNVAAATANTVAGPQAAIDATMQTDQDKVQAAVLAATAIAPAAGRLNRIAFNPAAAMGAFQGPAGNADKIASALPASAASPAFPARPMVMPFGVQNIANPAYAKIHLPDQPVLRAAALRTSGDVPAPAGHGHARSPDSRETIEAPEVSNAVTRSRRQQADLMLAQWAAQQIAIQKGAGGGAPAETENAGLDSDRPESQAAAVSGPAHPMLPPRSASPEWYAQAMDQALNRYRNGASAGIGRAPTVSQRH